MHLAEFYGILLTSREVHAYMYFVRQTRRMASCGQSRRVEKGAQVGHLLPVTVSHFVSNWMLNSGWSAYA